MVDVQSAWLKASLHIAGVDLVKKLALWNVLSPAQVEAERLIYPP